jgi:hypothetical protein
MVQKANNSLEQALAVLIQNQATFVSNLNDTNQRFGRVEMRFARIARELEQIREILLRHEHILSNLPEAIRDKIGFTPRP